MSTLMKQCIYLKGTETELLFESQEHIFPAGIGGIQKLPLEYVSHNANNAFSALELGFMRNSIIMLPRQFYGPGKRGNLSPKKASKSTVSLMTAVSAPESIEFGYMSLGKPYSIAQIKINVSTGKCGMMFDQSFGDASTQIQNFISKLGDYNNKYSLYEDERFSPDEFILGYQDNRWHLGLSNLKLIPEIQGYIKRLLDQTSFDNQVPQYGQSQPKVEQTIQMNNDFFRVCAKIIFNYLAYIKGRDFVLQEKFDLIRNWIVKGGEQSFATLSGKEQILKNYFSSINCPEKAHKLLILQNGSYLLGVISFYGGFETIVQLSDNYQEYFEAEGFICNWEEREEYSLKDFLINKLQE
ncbi:hypothetical protein [Priestia megaterium]|uniref:hypothetical protein n=1 Tax=Priestia megaterium TaxID=1404 RepID=UPI0017866113|nr:hypothetical protein [Priestia megaterium]MBD8115057.1 hypothetical protein [Priestia megaterium]